MPKRKSRKPPLLVRTALITQEIDDALNEEAAAREWGKSKLIRSILEQWLNYWRANTKRKSSAADLSRRGEAREVEK